MSNIDKRALREAAEKALPAMQRLLMMPNDELFDEALLNVDGDVDAANAFNLLTGPETVLELLDELEAKDKRITELEAREVKLPERYEVDMCPTPSPDGEWYSREDILAALVSADVSYADGNGKGK
ncbi:ead/Ea22-like family protein [Enterobacter cloacae complex sp. 402G1]|uniref:ead/Ea22-like family protein n=1 Tax=Enterobacter cloacae complex sp. 402G1 TaxID=3395864 RepID=UPI003CE79363